MSDLKMLNSTKYLYKLTFIKSSSFSSQNILPSAQKQIVVIITLMNDFVMAAIFCGIV